MLIGLFTVLSNALMVVGSVFLDRYLNIPGSNPHTTALNSPPITIVFSKHRDSIKQHLLNIPPPQSHSVL